MFRRPPTRRLLLTLLAWGACGLMGAVPAAAANGAASQSAAATAGLVAERVRLRAELERLQSEIDRLKKTDLGLRDDYRLRARMADAESVARRLTDIDAQLQRRAASAGTRPDDPAPPRQLGAEPGPAPGDGPVELDAKADILADQSRRLETQAASLRARVDQLRGRQELRRHSRQLEHDPFAPFEGSKRRMITGVGPANTPRTGGQNGAGTPASPTGLDRPPGTSAVPPTPYSPVPIAVPGTPVPPSPIAAVPPPSSVQLRDLLDAGTLAEMRKLEQAGSASANIEAMERAIAALTAKSQHLAAQAKALRDKAHAP
jgi:cell division protein FtsB